MKMIQTDVVRKGESEDYYRGYADGKYWCNACYEEIVEVEEWLLEQAIKHFDIRKVPRGCETCKYREAADEKQQSDPMV